jgi:WD40 repeat protein
MGLIHKQHEVGKLRQIIEIALPDVFMQLLDPPCVLVDFVYIEDVDDGGLAEKIAATYTTPLIPRVPSHDDRRHLHKLGYTFEDVLFRVLGEVSDQLVVDGRVRSQHEEKKTGDLIAVLAGAEPGKEVLESARFSRDGSRIVGASDFYNGPVWDTASKRLVGTLLGFGGSLLSAEFSPDGSRIVTASNDKTARIWDAATFQHIGVLQHDDQVLSATFSPDGSRVVTGCHNRTVRLWNASTNKSIAEMKLEGVPLSLVLSPNGSRIAASHDGLKPFVAHIWDGVTGTESALLRGHTSFVQSVAFSADSSQLVTASWDNTARIWDAATGNQIAALLQQDEDLQSAAFNHDGSRIVTTAWAIGTVWNVKSRKVIAVLRGHENSRVLSSAFFSSDGSRIVTYSLRGVREAVGIRRGAISGNMKISYYAARSIG